MNKLIVALLASSTLALSTASIAGGTTTIAPDNNMDNGDAAGFYIGANIGYGDVDVNLPSVPGITTSNRGVAWSAELGYQFNRYVALEVGGMRFADLTAKVNGTDESAKVTTGAFDVLVKGIYPISDQFNVFAKAGIAVLVHSEVLSGGGTSITTVDNNTQVVPMFALGFGYNITRNWSINLQGVATTSSGDSYPATYTGLVGVSYKFG